MGRGERFVQVQVQHIDADPVHVHDTHDSIHVGPVTVDKAALVVNDITDFPDIFFKEPQSVRVGHHDAGGFPVHYFGDGLRGQDALCVRCDRNRPVSAQGGTGGVGAVG